MTVADARHPIARALHAMSKTRSGQEPIRVVQARLSPDDVPQFLVALLAPDQLMDRQVVMLVDWSRSGVILPIAMPAYATRLRKSHPARGRLSKEFLWVLHYPENRLDDAAFDDVLRIVRQQGRLSDERAVEWEAILRPRLVEGLSLDVIAERFSHRAIRLASVVRDARLLLRRAGFATTPLDGYRTGAAMWGAFKLGWDSLAGTYVGEAEPRIPEALVMGMTEWLGRLPQPEKLEANRHVRSVDVEVDDTDAGLAATCFGHPLHVAGDM